MKDAEFEDLLRRWGRVYGEQAPAEWEEEGTASLMAVGGAAAHPIAMAMEYARGKDDRMVAVAYARPRAAVRAWRDPMPCTESRHYSGALYFSGSEQSRVAPDVSQVERAVMDLFRIDTLRGLIMRGQYCRRGPARDQVEWINGLDRGIAVNLRTFRDELAHARTWVHARIAE
jgi:hypothetical protein